MAETPTSNSPDRSFRGLSFPLAVSALYALVGGLYIALSDRILESWIEGTRRNGVDDVATLTVIQTYKGWGFIVLSAFALLLLLHRHERRRIEAGLALRESEQRYRRIVETTNEGVWIVDEDGVTTFVNDTLARMLGMTREQMIGRSHQDFIAEAWRGVAKRQFHRRRQGECNQYECCFVCADGAPLWAIVASAPLNDETGQFRGSVKMLTDITQRKADEEHLKSSYETQKQLLNELDHRVRNNLASLRSLLDLTRSATRDVDALATSLGGRLDAMGRAHAILSSARWAPPQMQALLDALIPGKVRPRFDLVGSSVLIPPSQVGAMAIVLHELIANAMRHGALAAPGGVGAVRVRWSAKPLTAADEPAASVETGHNEAGTLVTIHWEERGGLPIEQEPMPGPGTSLLRGLVRSDLQGAAELTYPRSGASHTLRVRLEKPAVARSAQSAPHGGSGSTAHA